MWIIPKHGDLFFNSRAKSDNFVARDKTLQNNHNEPRQSEH